MLVTCTFLVQCFVHAAGKNAMKVGVEKFNKDASAGYKRLSKKEKEKLKEQSDRRAADTVGKIMTPKEIKKAKAKLLKQSKNQVRLLCDS